MTNVEKLRHQERDAGIVHEAPTFSDEKSQSILTRLSGSVYRSTWNSPSASRVSHGICQLFCRSSTYARHHSSCTSPPFCYHGPSAPLAADRPLPASVGSRQACPYQSIVSQVTSALPVNRTTCQRAFHTPLSALFFFLTESSPCAPPRFDFRPFSSPGTGPDSFNAANRAGFGFLNV